MSQPTTGAIVLDEAKCLLRALGVPETIPNLRIVCDTLVNMVQIGVTKGSEGAIAGMQQAFDEAKGQRNERR